MRKSIFKPAHSLWMMAICIFLSACQKDVSSNNGSQASGNLQIHFQPIVDSYPLVFGKMYKNSFAEDYSIKTFKFYIHAIELSNSQTNNIYRVEKNNHYLINPADTSASYVKISVPSATYNRISFVIGVDSIRNVSGAQTGALDPAQGMFWTWSTGYIMAKLEGNSPVAATPNNDIEYHIGGFKAGESVLRRVTLDFPGLQKVDLKQGVHSNVTISANINSWFSSINPIHISQKPVSMTPGNLASQIADNYSRMFTVVEIVNE